MSLFNSAGAELLFGNIKRRQLALDGNQKCKFSNRSGKF